jgi:hypothetical protein
VLARALSRHPERFDRWRAQCGDDLAWTSESPLKGLQATVGRGGRTVRWRRKKVRAAAEVL